jgi:hypothetical protein
MENGQKMTSTHAIGIVRLSQIYQTGEKVNTCPFIGCGKILAKINKPPYEANEKKKLGRHSKSEKFNKIYM